MIQFDRVTFSYPKSARPALEAVSLRIAAGQLALITGASGSGKSTLLRCLNGLTPYFSGGRLRGQVRVAGLDPLAETPQRMSRVVGFVFQDPEAQFVVDRVEDEIAFGLENSGTPVDEIHRRIETLLPLLHLTALRTRRIDTLSGGEKQRVALATALAFQPAVLALDEPTSQLDPESAEEVLQAVRSLKEALGLTIVISEHRLERILPFADRLVVLEAGRITADGAPREVLRGTAADAPLAALGKRLGWSRLPLSLTEARALAAREGGYAGWQLNLAEPATDCASAGSDGSLKLGAANQEESAGSPVLRVEDLYAFRGSAPVLRGIDLELFTGEIAALVGPNGAGKTTLLRCLVGLLAPQRGRVTLTARDGSLLTVNAQTSAAVCRQVAYLPQDPNAMLFADTVEEELWITLHNHGLRTPPLAPLDLLARLGLADKAQRYPRDLSVGERQRVALAAVTITRPQAVLLDEPTRGLDAPAKASLASLLKQWRAEGQAILVVTHDVEWAAGLADRALHLADGRIREQGDVRRVLGGGPPFATQVAQVFPGLGWLTARDVEIQ